MAGLVVLAVLFIGLADRSAVTVIDLGAPRRIVVVNTAGPVEVKEAETGSLQHRDSWILSGPESEQLKVGEDIIVRIGCPGRGPCRSSVTVSAPPGTELVVVSSGVVTVGSFNGALTVLTESSHVALGPITGSARIVAHGDVIGTALQTGELDVSSVEGALTLDFSVAPNRLLMVGSTEPILATLPEDGSYRVAVEEAGGDVEIDIPELSDTDLPANIIARTSGSVRITRRQLAETTVDVGS